jgi:two-component system response regulator MprA
MPHRVLLADDDRAIRESLVRALDLAGYHVTEVTDGVRALATAPAETAWTC